MTLEEMKIKTYSLIEEYNEEADDLSEDEDLVAKFNAVCNQIQNELSRIKKINAYKKIDLSEGDLIDFLNIDKDFYQIATVKGLNVDFVANKIYAQETGSLEVFYYKYPTQIDDETDDDFVFELSTDVLEIMPYGIAADLLKSDVSSNYGQIYANRYTELKNALDTRYSLGGVYIEGGIDL